MKQLEAVTKNFRDCLGVSEDVTKSDKTDVSSILSSARSIREIVEKVPEFEYEEFKDGGCVTCVVDGVSFGYSRLQISLRDAWTKSFQI